jgi:uncharacterized peroxidase-related enzyme
MQTIHPVKAEDITVATQRLLDVANQERGALPNMLRTLAHSPRVLEGYLDLQKALSGSRLSPSVREQIALAVAQTNLCEYSLAEHAHRAAQLGLKGEQILESREARALDKRTDALLRFARDLAARKGESSVLELRENGCSDADIIEVIACVALNVFENYFNDVARTELDFPKVAQARQAAA